MIGLLAYVFLVLGLALVLVSLWSLKRFRDESAMEMDNIQLMKREIHRAKNDVEKLLLELNKASERAVQEMMQKIEEYRSDIPLIPETTIEQAAVSEVEDDELAGQIAMEFAIEPYQIPDKHLIVYQLAEQGLSPAEIAQKTKMGKGEVALILNLRNRSEHNVQILQ